MVHQAHPCGRYAWECQTPEGGWGLDHILRDSSWKFRGIVNGMDYNEWSPQQDVHLQSDGYQNYSQENLREGKAKCKEALQRVCCTRPFNHFGFRCISLQSLFVRSCIQSFIMHSFICSFVHSSIYHLVTLPFILLSHLFLVHYFHLQCSLLKACLSAHRAQSWSCGFVNYWVNTRCLLCRLSSLSV